MNKLFCLIFASIISKFCIGQNFVPNGDFEQFSSCPSGFSQIDSALFWMNPTNGVPTSGGSTSDYYNQCAPYNSFVSVPYNLNPDGFQPALSGFGYAGIYLWTYYFSNYREYIEVSLNSTLVSNVVYHFEMHINLLNKCGYISDDIGVLFSDTMFSSLLRDDILSFSPQLINAAGNYPDTLNWMLINGNYTAAGGENFLIIGNFKNDSNINTQVINSFASPYVYCYIDDVSFVEVTSSNTGINDATPFSDPYPNPFQDKLEIKSLKNGQYSIMIYDIMSRVLIEQNFTFKASLNTELLSKGIYFYRVISNNNVIKKGKLVKD